jgi:tetratricopeptide (TPR) repeat protein
VPFPPHRFASKEITDKEVAAASFQLACILRDQGRLPDAERVLQDFVNQFRGMQDELYMDGVACLADILTQRKFYTKAEMLARKALEEKVKVYGRDHHQVIKSMLQLASIAVSQKLYEEGEEHLREVLRKVQAAYGGETADSAAAYHTLSLCTFYR